MSRPRIRCVQDISAMLDPRAPVVTLFSGGLDSTYLLKLLREAGIHTVVALVVDLGDEIDQAELQTKATKMGAELQVVAAREQFAAEFVLPAVQAQAFYHGNYPISSSLSRPLIARAAMEVARERGAQAILHSAHPSQNTLRRINGALELLGYDGIFGTPYELTPVPRPAEAAALAEAGIVDLADRAISMDSNLWCREFEAGEIDDPESFTVPEHLYTWTRANQPITSTRVTVRYEQGVPVELDGRRLPPVELITELNQLAGPHQLGRYVGLEHLGSGEKVLETREMPAAQVLLSGYAHLLSATVDSETIREKMHLDMLWVREAIEGRWFGPSRAAAQAFIENVGAQVNGTVGLRLGPGGLTPFSIRAERPLYIRDREAWEFDSARQAEIAAAGPAAAQERHYPDPRR